LTRGISTPDFLRVFRVGPMHIYTPTLHDACLGRGFRATRLDSIPDILTLGIEITTDFRRGLVADRPCQLVELSHGGL
jgi:hypothetical protein